MKKKELINGKKKINKKKKLVITNFFGVSNSQVTDTEMKTIKRWWSRKRKCSVNTF